MDIVRKVTKKQERTLADGGCSPQTPYGLLSTFRGPAKRENDDDLEVLSSKGWMYVSRQNVTKSVESLDQYKAMISKLSCEHAGNPDKSGMYRVLSRMELLKPGQICTQSYLTVCPTNSVNEARNVFIYLRTKFVRFLILQTLAGMNISINNFQFVPWLDFTKRWSDSELYARYNLTNSEIDYIEAIIRDMDTQAEDDE